MTTDAQGRDDARIAEIRARVEAITPPWTLEWEGQG